MFLMWIHTQEAVSYYFSVATVTSFLNYPLSPKEVYVNNIEAAEAGDGRSMYKVSKAFYECSKAPRNREHFEKFYLIQPLIIKATKWNQLAKINFNCLK